MSLINLRTFGRSGLIVSPLSLSTMIFGTPLGGRPTIFRNAFSTLTSRPVVILSTPPMHAGGRSEELVGGYIADRGLPDQLVLTTKFDFSGGPGNPNAGGNGRKNIHCALEGSPCRLQTDCVDLYWLHVWDMVTPVEEVLQTLGDLMRGGKTRYFGFSDMLAWYAAKAATLAAAHAVPGLVAMQLAYSLVERSIEYEYVSVARECGLGITPWSPLAAGFPASKYQRDEAWATGEGRLTGPNPFGNTLFTDRNWRVLDALRAVAAQAERPLAQVALA